MLENKKVGRNANYVKEMRKHFSNKNSILPNGDLNHKYFQTKIGQYWTENEENKLIKGIEDYGVGAWKEIKQNLLPNWTETDLSLRTGYIFKTTNVDTYNYLTFTREEVEEIAQQNEKEAKAKNKFKYNLYFN